MNEAVNVAFIEVLLSVTEDKLPGLLTTASFGPNTE